MSLSLARQYQLGDDRARVQAISLLSENQRVEILTSTPWWWYGRPEQFTPLGAWRWWLINAGRGWGKTRCGAEWVCQKARQFPGARIALVAINFADGRDVMVEGESGILSVLDLSELRGGTLEKGWNRGYGELFMANGSQMKIYSSQKPFGLRGPQHHFTWGDEPAYWLDVSRGTDRDSTWSNLNIGLRLPPRRDWVGYNAQGILTTTPRRVPLLKVDDDIARDEPHRAGLMQRHDVIVTRGTSMDNIHNLEASYRANVIDPIIGTELGRQEIGGELLEEVQGAQWTQKLITQARTDAELPVDVAKTVVAFDPAGDGGDSHDEHGIIVASSAGPIGDLRYYMRADYSGNMEVDVAARVVITAAIAYGADAIVYEKNIGQRWIEVTLRGVFADMLREGELQPETRLPRIASVDAVKNKYQRATPVAALYRIDRVKHVEPLPVLEGQMTTFVPGETASPDRLDAAVWAVTWLRATGPMQASAASPAARERGGRRPGQPSSRLPEVYGYRGPRG